MSWEKYIDAEEVRRAIEALQDPGGVFEVRAIGTTKKDILSGYFRDADTLLKAFDTIDMRSRNVYITLGKVKDECFSRAQSERFLKSPQTTSDTEIVSYRWLFVDLDPARTAGISSSDQELSDARDMAHEVLEYMQGLGFADPVTAASGNGYHLLYRIDVKNDEAGRKLIERCLKVLSAVFDSDKVKIDTTNSNPSRICKLHGTLAQKGRSTSDRPHRMSGIINVPDPIEMTETDTLLKLVAELPEEPEYERRGAGVSSQQEFDLLNFMQTNGITYTEDSNDRSKIFKLDECPFDPSHKDGDAKIFLYGNGAIAFKCHHNSCSQYRWQDVRMKFEPGAYDHEHNREADARIDAGYLEHVRQMKAEGAAPEAPKKKTPMIRKLKTAAGLMEKNLPEPTVFVGVGEELPLLVEGTCILSAKPKLGKSWFAMCMLLAIAKGEDFIGYKTRKCSVLYLDLETSEQLQQKRLRKILKDEPVPDNFYLDTETENLDNGFIDQLEAYIKEDPQIGVIVVDVFQIIKSSAKSFKETEYEHAYRDITPLNSFAQKYHVSIILVCHDRKAVDPDDPFANILGSTGLQGAATQMIVMFKKKNEPIHVSVKGKTIDGLPEMNVQIINGEWSVVAGVSAAEAEAAEAVAQYRTSQIREAVLAIAEHNTMWKGRCGTLMQDAIQLYNIPLTEPPKQIGGFLHKHQGRFLAEDDIKITIIDNGTGPKIYRIEKFTIDTIDETEQLPLMEWEEVSKYKGFEVPFS